MHARTRIVLRPLALLAAAGAVSAQTGRLFDAAMHIPGSDHGEFRASGDFDNDGRLDLVHTTNWLNPKGVTLFLGDGTGGFAAQTEYVFSIPPGFEYAERDPAVGDFDGDGNLDVAFDRNSVLSLDGIVVYFGDGAGGFGSILEVGLGNYVAALYAGEIDGDAGTELLVKHDDLGYQDHLTWLNWNGSGFSLSASLPVGGAPDPAGCFVETLGDFDGDGDDDLAATSTSPYALVRLFPTVNGNPTYGPSFPVPAPMQNVNHRIKAADLDGDGDIDLVHLKMFTSDPGPWVQAYENVGGAFVQHPAESVPTPKTGWFQPHDLRLGDWNGDGWIDLFSLSQFVDVVRSDGDWTFSEGMEFYDISQSPGVGVHDVDGDGYADFIGARTIHWGHWAKGEFVGHEPNLPVASASFPDGLVALDLDGDGDVDLAGGTSGARHVNDGTGLFTYLTGPTGFLSSFFPAAPAAGYSYGSSVAFADFTGDGLPDYLVQMLFSFSGFPAFVEMRMLADDGAGSYVDVGVAAPALVQIFQPDQAPDAHWEAADADGDGDVDLLVEGGYWRNSGSGYLEALVSTGAGRVFDAADVDGDGDVDLLAVAPVGALEEVRIQRNLGGGYDSLALGTLTGDPVATFVDLDEDGDADVAAADPAGNQLMLVQNSGGAFAAAVFLPANAKNIRMLGVADLDGDGVTDLLTQRLENQGVPSSVQIITEHRRTGPGLDYVKASEYLSASLYSVFDGALDVDGDGDLDLVGKGVQRGQTVTPADSGVIQQFGVGLAGTGGVVPVLGGKGPPTSTSVGAEMRLVHAVGGGTMWIAFSLSEISVAGVPLPGMTLYVGSPAILGGFPLGGPAGKKGAGSFELPLPKIPALNGLAIVHQMFVVDPGSPVGWTSTNGLRITYGP